MTVVETRRSKRELLLHLVAEQGGLCAYCDVPLVTIGRNPRMATLEHATLEHVVPVAAGGTSDEPNIVAACWQCNRLKGSLTLDQLRKLVARIEALSTARVLGRG
jgi:5-methylcytosine-specific restriction endonuclease McrA